MPFNEYTFTGIDIDTFPRFHRLHLESAESLDLHLSAILKFGTYDGEECINKGHRISCRQLVKPGQCVRYHLHSCLSHFLFLLFLLVL